MSNAAKRWRLDPVMLCTACLSSCVRVAQPSVVVIQFPINGTTYALGETVTFAGTAM